MGVSAWALASLEKVITTLCSLLGVFRVSWQGCVGKAGTQAPAWLLAWEAGPTWVSPLLTDSNILLPRRIPKATRTVLW